MLEYDKNTNGGQDDTIIVLTTNTQHKQWRSGKGILLFLADSYIIIDIHTF